MLLVGLLLAAAGWAYLQVGRTPGELIDYTQRRLEGHPKLETVALPVLEATRRVLDEPSREARALPFIVPPVPALQKVSMPGGPAASGDPMRLLVGPGRALTTPSQAARVAPDGAVVEIDPGDYRGDVALWHQRRLTLRGTGPGVRLFADGRSVEGKAIWVIRRGSFVVENIEFIGARVPDRNGAGIRFEGGELTVRNCRFHDNETGLLVGGPPDTRVVVEHSEFGYSGAGDGQSHGIYIGGIDSFRLTGSYFHHANVGQLVKSRARHNRIEYNRLTDEVGGRASYELEFPSGGEAEIVGNIIQQGSDTRNSNMVSFGAEGYAWPVNRLAMSHNTLVNDRRYGGTFVRVWPGAQAAVMRNNLLVGQGSLSLPPGVADRSGDQTAAWEDFVQAAREDYRLTPRARLRLSTLAPQLPGLVPVQEYVHPLRTVALPGPPTVAGAVQAQAP